MAQLNWSELARLDMEEIIRYYEKMRNIQRGQILKFK